MCVFLVIYPSYLSRWSLQKPQLLWDRNLTLQNLWSALLHGGQRPGDIVLQLPDTKGQCDCRWIESIISRCSQRFARGFTVVFLRGDYLSELTATTFDSSSVLFCCCCCCVAFPAAVRSRTKSVNFSEPLRFSNLSPFPSLRSPSTRSLQSPEPRCHLCQQWDQPGRCGDLWLWLRLHISTVF